MEPLVRVSLAMRALWRRGQGVLMACALATYVVLGGASDGGATASPHRGQNLGWPGAVLVGATALWAAVLYARVRRKVREPGDAGLMVDVDIGVLLAVGLQAALVRFDGGLSGRFSAAVYVLVALVAAFARPVAGLLVVAWVIALDAALRFVTCGDTDTTAFTTHAGFVAAFPL